MKKHNPILAQALICYLSKHYEKSQTLIRHLIFCSEVLKFAPCLNDLIVWIIYITTHSFNGMIVIITPSLLTQLVSHYDSTHTLSLSLWLLKDVLCCVHLPQFVCMFNDAAWSTIVNWFLIAIPLLVCMAWLSFVSVSLSLSQHALPMAPKLYYWWRISLSSHAITGCSIRVDRSLNSWDHFHLLLIPIKLMTLKPRS